MSLTLHACHFGSGRNPNDGSKSAIVLDEKKQTLGDAWEIGRAHVIRRDYCKK